MSIHLESRTRSIVKALSWRIWATFATFLLVFAFTGELKLAASIGFVEMIMKFIIYFVHERFWNRIPFGRITTQPCVIWFTGLSGAGKSTIAELVYQHLQKTGMKVEHLDGDKIRDVFPKTGFTKDDRNAHIKRVGHLASILEKNGITVVASFVSPYEEARLFVRSHCRNFTEVYLSTPLAVCEQRDVKGLYKKARSGQLKNFTGINAPYEIPTDPEINLDTSKISIEDAKNKVINVALSHKQKGIIPKWTNFQNLKVKASSL